jgi:RecB family endonuclease NucS
MAGVIKVLTLTQTHSHTHTRADEDDMAACIAEMPQVLDAAFESHDHHVQGKYIYIHIYICVCVCVLCV